MELEAKNNYAGEGLPGHSGRAQQTRRLLTAYVLALWQHLPLPKVLPQIGQRRK
jgi:hypothetical protein